MAERTQTIYNGTEPCGGCGFPLNPVESIYAYSEKLCPTCRNNKVKTLIKNRMS